MLIAELFERDPELCKSDFCYICVQKLGFIYIEQDFLSVTKNSSPRVDRHMCYYTPYLHLLLTFILNLIGWYL